MFLSIDFRWNKIIHLLFYFLLNSSINIFAAESFTNEQNHVDKSTEEDLAQNTEDQIQSKNEDFLLKPILVLCVFGAIIIGAVFSMRAKALHYGNELCRTSHHHAPGVHCKVELFNMGWSGYKVINPDNND